MTNPSFETLLGKDIWVLAHRIGDQDFYNWRYIRILELTDTLMYFAEIEAELVDDFLAQGLSLLDYERRDIELALALSAYASGYERRDQWEIETPISAYTTEELQEMVDSCGEEPADDPDIDYSDEDDI